ncbi:MAG: hypothetical protein R3F11_30045 [Verrucomicrobiales bacterium]
MMAARALAVHGPGGREILAQSNFKLAPFMETAKKQPGKSPWRALLLIALGAVIGVLGTRFIAGGGTDFLGWRKPTRLWIDPGETLLVPENSVFILRQEKPYPGKEPLEFIVTNGDGAFSMAQMPEDSFSGTKLGVILYSPDDAQIQVSRNFQAGESQGHSVVHLDIDGDGLVDYRQSGDGVDRVKKIEWERIGGRLDNLPQRDPQDPGMEIPVHRTGKEYLQFSKEIPLGEGTPLD